MEILDAYTEELKKDTTVNDFNVKEVQMRLPAKKHYWASRLIDAKRNLLKLQDKRRKEKDRLTKETIEQSQVRISIATAQDAVEKSNVIQQLTNDIKEHEIIIEYLEKVEKILQSMTWDIKNIITIMQMETQ